MSNSLSRLVAPMLFLALAVPTFVLAQAPDTANVNGVVLDASGRPAAGYPMRIMTPQSGEVIINPTENDGKFGVEGLPPGDYELRVFEPGGSTNPIASKQITLAAGQKEQIEIRLGSDNPAGSAAGGPAAGSGLNWTAIAIAAMVLAAAIGVLFMVRSQRRPGE